MEQELPGQRGERTFRQISFLQGLLPPMTDCLHANQDFYKLSHGVRVRQMTSFLQRHVWRQKNHMKTQQLIQHFLLFLIVSISNRWGLGNELAWQSEASAKCMGNHLGFLSLSFFICEIRGLGYIWCSITFQVAVHRKDGTQCVRQNSCSAWVPTG